MKHIVLSISELEQSADVVELSEACLSNCMKLLILCMQCITRGGRRERGQEGLPVLCLPWNTAGFTYMYIHLRRCTRSVLGLRALSFLPFLPLERGVFVVCSASELEWPSILRGRTYWMPYSKHSTAQGSRLGWRRCGVAIRGARRVMGRRTWASGRSPVTLPQCGEGG